MSHCAGLSCNCRQDLGPLPRDRKQSSKTTVGRIWFPGAQEVQNAILQGGGDSFPLEQNPFYKGMKPIYSIVSPESVLIPLNYFIQQKDDWQAVQTLIRRHIIDAAWCLIRVPTVSRNI